MNHFLTSKENDVITLLFESLGDRDWRHIGELVEAGGREGNRNFRRLFNVHKRDDAARDA